MFTTFTIRELLLRNVLFNFWTHSGCNKFCTHFSFQTANCIFLALNNVLRRLDSLDRFTFELLLKSMVKERLRCTSFKTTSNRIFNSFLTRSIRNIFFKISHRTRRIKHLPRSWSWCIFLT